MKVDELIVSLTTYESVVNERLEKKDKNIAFVANAYDDNKELENESDSNESISEAIVSLG
ncbi:gag-pol polyprotein, partial [Trifolium medium]|nr:gag-pol polyprotein [Trifolium medium]